MTIADNSRDVHAESGLMVVATHRGGVEVIERWADEWRTLCDESTDDQPFYRPEWIAAHIRAFSPAAKVVVLTVHCEGKLLFVLPLLQEWSLAGGIPLRKLRGPVNSHSCRFDAVRHSSSAGKDAVAAAWKHLQSLPGWDLLEIHDVPEGGTIADLARAASDGQVYVAQLPMLPGPHVAVPSNPADLEKLPANKKLRSQLRGVRRELEKKGNLKLQRGNRSTLARFYELEAAGWKGTEGSAIACNPRVRQFYDEISQAAERFGYLCVYTLELEGELLASHFGFSHKGRYFSPKVAYNENFPQYAPGHLIVSEILQDCASRGISEYDITGVNDEWKMKWTSETRAKFMYFVYRRGFPGGLAHALRFRLKPTLKKLVGR